MISVGAAFYEMFSVFDVVKHEQEQVLIHLMTWPIILRRYSIINQHRSKAPKFFNII